MKRKAPLFLLITLFACTSCSGKSSVIDQKGANVFPASALEDTIEITMGDVMPFYDNGVMNIYHLRNTTGSNSNFYHPIARLTTSDFIHYKDEGVVINYEESIFSPDAALGTGSFIKDKDGKYHCFYTGHNTSGTDPDLGEDALPYAEVVRHAVSDDQITWVKDDEFRLYGYENDFRDPYVYYDEVDRLYYMLITTRDYGNAVIRRYSSSSLSVDDEGWTFVDNFFTNDEGSYNMECPSYVEYNGFYYLAYSEQGKNRVTHYRYKTSRDGEWKKFSRDAIDASGFYAGRLEKAGDKLYAFAWCARLTGGNTGTFDWGGNLVSHEMKQNADGEIFPIMPSNYKSYFNHEVTYANSKGEKVSNYSFNGEKFEATTLDKKSELVTRISFKMKPNSLTGDFGLTFGTNNQYDNRLGDSIIGFDLTNNRLMCYNDVSNIIRYGKELAHVNYQFEQGKTYDVDAIIDGEVITLYLNNEIALTARFLNMEENYFAFYSNKAKAEITEAKFYE